MVAPTYGQGGPRKKKIIYNNLKFYIYLPLKKYWDRQEFFFMPIKLNFNL